VGFSGTLIAPRVTLAPGHATWQIQRFGLADVDACPNPAWQTNRRTRSRPEDSLFIGAILAPVRGQPNAILRDEAERWPRSIRNNLSSRQQQLMQLWPEYPRCIGTVTPHYSTLVGNPFCCFTFGAFVVRTAVKSCSQTVRKSLAAFERVTEEKDYEVFRMAGAAGLEPCGQTCRKHLIH
jgi:hypothetical protein